MVTIERYEELLGSGLGLDHFFILQCLYNEEKLPNNRRINGFINLLVKKGYIKDGKLTELAINLVQESTTTTTTVAPTLPIKTNNLNVWVAELHKSCQDKLVKLTGKKQVRGQVKGTSYSFLCNSLDLYKNIDKIIKLYNLKDLPAIQKTIENFIDKCHKEKNWFPILYYYIFKDGKSQLVTDLENLNDTVSEETNETINPIDYATEG